VRLFRLCSSKVIFRSQWSSFMHGRIARGFRRLAGFAAIAAFSCAASAAGEGGRVDGTLESDGKAIRLSHVLVVSIGNEEGLEDSARLRIFLSDAEIPLRVASAASTTGARFWARGAEAAAAVVMADPTGKAKGGVAIVLGVPGARGNVIFWTMSSSDGLAPFKVVAGRASGSVAFDGPQGRLNARFDAPIVVASVTQDLKEGAAADSAQVKALLAYRAALKKGDLKEAARFATAARMKQIDEFRAESPEVYTSMLKEMPDGKALAKTVRRVVVRGELASIILSTKEIDEMVFEGGAWKAD